MLVGHNRRHNHSSTTRSSDPQRSRRSHLEGNYAGALLNSVECIAILFPGIKRNSCKGGMRAEGKWKEPQSFSRKEKSE